MKTLNILLLVGLIAGVGPASVEAASINAATCSQSDVQSAINSAADGDTVFVPAGECVWTSGVSIVRKEVAVIGAGIERTIIVDSLPRGSRTTVVLADTAEGKFFRLSGMTFRSGDVQKSYDGMIIIGGTSKSWRIDHVRLDRPKNSGIRVYGFTYGVIDHCAFDLDGTQAIIVWHEAWGGASFGDGSWYAPLAFGTRNAVYIEDNTFTNTWPIGTIDSMAGGRYVLRHNQFTNDFAGNHGTESTQRYRSARSYEIYNNTFTMVGRRNWTAVFLRGGTGVVFSNTLVGYDHAVVVSNFRSREPFTPWGACDGSNGFDGNQQANGYPCLDQVGRSIGDLLTGTTPAAVWPNQALDPLYVWSNTVDGSPGGVNSDFPSVIQEGRDYITAPRPGYQPYIYPHPLTQGPSPMPAAPRNLTVGNGN